MDDRWVTVPKQYLVNHYLSSKVLLVSLKQISTHSIAKVAREERKSIWYLIGNGGGGLSKVDLTLYHRHHDK